MQTLINFKEFLDKLNLSNSRNYKIEVLQSFKDNEDVKYYLNFLLNPYIITGISTKKLKREVETDYTLELNTFKDILNYAKEHNTGSDRDLSIIFTNRDTIFEKYSGKIDEIELYELYTLYNSILIKNFPLGIDAKTVNKVIPGLIPTFNVMLSNKYFDNPTIVNGKKFALTTKIDGSRIIAIKKNGEAKFYTRQGQEYEGLVDLKYEMEKYMPDNICLDGEITLLNPYVDSSVSDFVKEDLWQDDSAPRICTVTKLSSKDQYKQTMMITRKDGEKHGVKMLVFDYMTADEFENQTCNAIYSERRNLLTELFSRAEYIKTQEEDLPIMYFNLLPILYEGTDTNQITKWLNTNISNGEEGVMINICDAPYEFKRTNSLLKVKKMQDLDLEVIGFEEGTNSNAGRLGALLVNYKDNIVKVGSGFTQELREEIWNNKEEWLGRTIVVQYFEETKNQNGGISLRFPVYLDYRTDK